MLQLYSCAVWGCVDINHNFMLLHLRSLWSAVRAWKGGHRRQKKRKKAPRLPRQRPWQRGTTTWEGMTKSGMEFKGELTSTGTSLRKHLKHTKSSVWEKHAKGSIWGETWYFSSRWLTCGREAERNCDRADLLAPKCHRTLASMWRRWEGAARAGAGGRRWSYSSSTSTSSSRWIRSSTSSSRWIRSPSASSFCHQRLPHLLLLLLTTLSFSFRHLSSLSGNISRQTTKHRIPLNLKNFADSGTALVGRWAGTERGRGGEHTQIPRYSHPA